MRRTVPCLLVVLLGVAVAALVGCPTGKDTTVTEAGPATTGVSPPPETTITEPEVEPAEGALTEESVKNFMASMEDDAIEEAMDEIGEEMGVEGKADPETIRKAFDAMAANEKLDEAVKAHGFSGAEEWVATARKVFPGLAYAMAVAMAEFMGIEEDSDEFKELVDTSEFAELEGVFEEPTEEEQQIIVDAVKEMMKEAEAEAGAGEASG